VLASALSNAFLSTGVLSKRNIKWVAEMDKPLIFLSHAGEDSQLAKELALHLKEAGLGVWLDVERLKPGNRWMTKIEDGLRDAKTFVLYVGKSGVRNWVDQEVRVALDRSTKEKDFRLIPVLGHHSDPNALPLFLQQYQWLDLRKGLTEAAQLKALIEGATERPAEGVSLLPPGKSPFRGLQVFDVEDSLLFFGRDVEIQKLLEKLKADSFLAVVGDSGSGKSSLVRAGLIPALHRGRFHDGKGWVESWRIAITRPGEDPFGELAKALLDLNPQLSAAEKADFLENRRDKLARQPDRLDNAIAALVPRGIRTLLVVDQFEELFTLAT
jgi:TIR domain/AAA ATPase domain